ncbi:MAG: efflux RND transporter periplasmic adaptor subunit [Burkholderiaceae bacterium]|nr:efflux RND transporter periplasmic adaptor subunit [Burkholderiaceae bacterium]MEB2318705.1 efflux RND transporter periplasmic adaptor subunit [Pseudomonadota bacterium]
MRRAPHPGERGRIAAGWLIGLGLLVAVGLGLWWASEPGRPLAGWRPGAPASQDGAAGPGPRSSRAGSAGGSRQGWQGGTGAQAPLVTVAEARRQDIRVTIDAIGSVVARRTAVVQPRVDGELLSLHFREGESVKAGQLLAKIDPVPFRIALAQAEAALARDQAQLASARRDLERFRGLLAKDAIARQQVDNQQALADQLDATVRAGKALVDEARLQLSYTEVTAPIGGVAGLRRLDPGNRVRASDTEGIVTIVQVMPVDVVFSVPEAVLPRIRAARAAGRDMAVTLFDRDGLRQIAEGRLSTVDNAIDAATGSIRAKAEFANKDRSLFPNQFVNVRIEVDLLADRLTVPVAAVQRSNRGASLAVVLPDMTIASRPVETGERDRDWIEVSGQIEAGDKVVIDGAERVPAGASVRIAGQGTVQGAGAAQ